MSKKKKTSANVVPLRPAATAYVPPSGHIDCGDKPMAYWLPDGVSPESIGLQPDEKKREREPFLTA